MEGYDYNAGLEGLLGSPRTDVREEVYVRLIMRMFGMNREEAMAALKQHGGVDKFAALVQKQTPESINKNIENAVNYMDTARNKSFDPDLY